MMQESVAIDLGDMVREPSTGFKVYVLFLMAACVMTCIKLIRVWALAWPFRESAKAMQYRRLLRASSSSLKQWIVCVLLSYGILISTSLYDVCKAVLNDNRMGGAALLFVVQDYAGGLSMALSVVLFVFLARWHLLWRIERLADHCEAQEQL
jgi:hypothetical protein